MSEMGSALATAIAAKDAEAVRGLLADDVDFKALTPGCPICVDARKIDKATMVSNAEVGGTVPMWEWIGAEAPTTFSY